MSSVQGAMTCIIANHKRESLATSIEGVIARQPFPGGATSNLCIRSSFTPLEQF